MPRTPRRRPPARRSLPPRPVIERTHSASTAAVAASQAPAQQGQSAKRRVARGLSERDARLLIADMKRVAVVSGTCLGLLAILVAVDRLM